MEMKFFLSISIVLFFSLMSIAQSAFEQATAAYEQRDYEKALAASSVQIEQFASPEALMLRGDCYHKLGDYSNALEDYDRSKISGYKGDDIYLNRGICKISLNLFEPAKLDLVTYVERNEDDPKGYYWLATLEYMQMEHKACLRYIDEAIWRDSTYAAAYYLRAANYAEQKKLNFALEDFEMAFSLDPKLFRAKMNMAVILMDMGQYKNAVELFSEVRLEDIDFISEVLCFRGEALYNLHDMEGACGDWVEAAHLGDPDAEANYKRLCVDKHDKPRFKRRNYMQF
jgi:tetratricopeptide (TPR) repeat protein